MQTNFYQYDWSDAEIVNILIDCDRIEPLLDLAVELSNHITFHIYCYGVQAEQ